MLSLRDLRERCGLTQKALAEMSQFVRADGTVAHLEQTTISALERGIVLDPKKSTIEALARGLHCSVLDVWHGINESVRENQRAEDHHRAAER